jgi:hypothetical protein
MISELSVYDRVVGAEKQRLCSGQNYNLILEISLLGFLAQWPVFMLTFFVVVLASSGYMTQYIDTYNLGI